MYHGKKIDLCEGQQNVTDQNSLRPKVLGESPWGASILRWILIASWRGIFRVSPSLWSTLASQLTDAYFSVVPPIARDAYCIILLWSIIHMFIKFLTYAVTCGDLPRRRLSFLHSSSQTPDREEPGDGTKVVSHVSEWSLGQRRLGFGQRCV